MEEGPTTRRAARHTERDRPRSTSLLILFVAFLVLVGGAVGASSYYRGCKEPQDAGGKAVRFGVPHGATADNVVTDLAEAGLIRCGGFVGNLLIRGTGKASELRAGTYMLQPGMTLDEIVEVLSTPPPRVPTVSVLIPPGHRLTQIAAAVDDALGIRTKRFLGAAESGNYVLEPYLPKDATSVEGFIWPETNRYPKKDTTADDVIRRALDQFETGVQGLPWGNAKGLGVSNYEVVVIASMIEKEAVIEADRAKIAAVIYNRLAKGMTLGIDATVGYIDPDPRDGLTAADFAIDSPYNTRLNPGLPPTPIASPSLESLRAALAPADVPYLFYVACGTDGGHRFSASYDQFLADKAACLG